MVAQMATPNFTAHVSYTTVHGSFNFRVLLTSRLELKTWLGSVAGPKLLLSPSGQSLFLVVFPGGENSTLVVCLLAM